MIHAGSDSSGLERVKRRIAERQESSCDLQGTLGMICVDLNDAGNGEWTFRQEWDDWLGRAFPMRDVWLGDELGGHLWVYAELPHAMPFRAEAALEDIARQIRQAVADETGISAAGTAPGFSARGYGVSLLEVSAGMPLKQTLYKSALEAIRNMGKTDPSASGSELHSEMERLLRERSIRSVYQPIKSLGSGEIFGYEALTRCPQPCRFDGPLALFGFAEKEGYAFALDRLAREKAIHGSPALSETQKIFINVTNGIMNDPQFVSGQTVRWLRERGMNPNQVVLELTERSSIDDFGAAKKILNHYRSQGYQIAIDDAGAGYSSLQAIVELSPDYIKVDKSLVRHADGDEMKKQMLLTFVGFAKRMNIRTVAEGIEREEELRLVREIGVDYGQGYLLGRPGDYGSPFCPPGLAL